MKHEREEGGPGSSDKLPPGSFNAHWFQFFNAVSFQIMMGAPIILYAKSLGASSTVIGIIAAFTPLMTIFQLPAARFLDRFSYRDFVLAGWGLRTVLIFVVAAIPLAAFLDPASKTAVLLAVLFLFNLLRGISTAAWMPWMAALIPETRRGRFLSLDQIFMYAGALVSLAASAWALADKVDNWEYSLVFLVSAIGGALSLIFIKRIPGVESAETIKRGSAKVPWKAMLGYPPFLRLLAFNVLFMVVLGSLGVFTVEFMRDVVGLDASKVLVLSGFSFVGALVVLPFLGMAVDGMGSKPVMRVATGVFTAMIGGWFLLSSGVLPPAAALIMTLTFGTGMASAAYNLANVRIAMATMPEMGRNHFFALFTVITSLGLGAAPVVWGLTLDAIGTFEAVTGAFTWKRHSIYFLVLFVLAAASVFVVRILVESPPGPPPDSSLTYAKLKRWPRIWQR
jgi:MFS family permease